MAGTIIVPIEVTDSEVQIPFVLDESEVLIPFEIETDTEIVPLQLETGIVINRDVDYYEGTYNVTPKAYDGTVLETNDKFLTDNVTVTKVPYFEVSNASGITVYIADTGEING